MNPGRVIVKHEIFRASSYGQRVDKFEIGYCGVHGWQFALVGPLSICIFSCITCICADAFCHFCLINEYDDVFDGLCPSNVLWHSTFRVELCISSFCNVMILCGGKILGLHRI